MLVFVVLQTGTQLNTAFVLILGDVGEMKSRLIQLEQENSKVITDY